MTKNLIGSRIKLKNGVVLLVDQDPTVYTYKIFNFSTKKYESISKLELVLNPDENYVQEDLRPKDTVYAIQHDISSIKLVMGTILSEHTPEDSQTIYDVQISGEALPSQYYWGELFKVNCDKPLNCKDSVQIIADNNEFLKQGVIDSVNLEFDMYTVVGIPTYQDKKKGLKPEYLGFYPRNQLVKLENNQETPVESPKCTHEAKVKNFISANLHFWYCPSCGADLGDVK